MGFYKMLVLFISLSLLLTPVIALKGRNITGPETVTQQTEEQPTVDAQQPESVRVLLTGSDEVVEVDLQEYLTGVLAAEMPAGYHTQALKAQAVAAYTYLLYKKQSASGEYDITDDSASHQGYNTQAVRNEKWGEKAEAYEKKTSQAVEEVLGRYVEYKGEPIMAAFHAISCGETLSAATVWGGEIGYLQSVPSPGDKLSPDCIKTVVFSAAEFSAAVSTLDGCEPDGEAENWLGSIKTDSSGYVTGMEICSKTYTGMQVREVLGLRSAVFTAQYSNGSFRFTTTGYGHCVGMSQYGADYMARQGSTWEEILQHYYPGTNIKEN